VAGTALADGSALLSVLATSSSPANGFHNRLRQLLDKQGDAVRALDDLRRYLVAKSVVSRHSFDQHRALMPSEVSRCTFFHGLRCAVIDGRSGPTRSHMPRVTSGVNFTHLKTVLNFPMMWQAPPSPDPGLFVLDNKETLYPPSGIA
jgi:hypothetical protein